MNKETKLKNTIERYSHKISTKHRAMNNLVDSYNSIRDEITNHRAAKKELNIKMKAKKYDHDEFVELLGQEMVLDESVAKASSMLSYLSEAIGGYKRELKQLQTIQSLYIEMLKICHNGTNKQ